jgi:hypothetical protein
LLCSQQLNAARTPTTRARKSARKLARNNPRPNPNWAGAKASTAAEALQKIFSLYRDQTRTGQARKLLTTAEALQNFTFFSTKPKQGRRNLSTQNSNIAATVTAKHRHECHASLRHATGATGATTTTTTPKPTTLSKYTMANSE